MMKHLTTGEVVEQLVASALQGGLAPSMWRSHRQKLGRDIQAGYWPLSWRVNHPEHFEPVQHHHHNYWPRHWPEFDPVRYADQLAPLHFDEQRRGFGRPLAEFEGLGGPSYDPVYGWWDITVVPDEPGTVLVAGGFLAGDLQMKPSRADHKLFWFRRCGLEWPDQWDALVLDAPDRWSAAALRQLHQWQPEATQLPQAA
jgi:hypothetical protein